MLNKITFLSDEDCNAFFKGTIDKDGRQLFYLVKFVVVFNPFERKQEFHMIYSTNGIMAGGEHMRKIP